MQSVEASLSISICTDERTHECPDRLTRRAGEWDRVQANMGLDGVNGCV